jgi:CRP-like cAMP-binding protein
MRRVTLARGRGRVPSRRRSPTNKASALRSVPELAMLPAPRRAELAELFDELRVPAGSVLARAGRQASELVLIVDGRATAVGAEPSRTLGPGQFVGAPEVVGRAGHIATVIADTPMHLLVAGPATLPRVLDQPAVLRHIVTRLAERRRDAESAVPEPAA